MLKELGLESSTSNARRVIEQGGVNIGPDREVITDPKALVHVDDGLIVRVGKRKIVRVALRQEAVGSSAVGSQAVKLRNARPCSLDRRGLQDTSRRRSKVQLLENRQTPLYCLLPTAYCRLSE